MMNISIEDMQRDLIGYLRRVEAGETLVITEANRPVAEVKPVSETTNQMRSGPVLLLYAKAILRSQRTLTPRFRQKSWTNLRADEAVA